MPLMRDKFSTSASATNNRSNFNKSPPTHLRRNISLIQDVQGQGPLKRPYFFHSLKDSNRRPCVITKKCTHLLCHFCSNVSISMDTLWIHMNRNHEGILFRALRAEDGTIHISGKRKKESDFSPDGLNALYCLEVVKDDASSQSFDLEIAIRNGLRPPKRAYYHMTNFRKVAIGEWMLDIDPEDSIDLMWRNQMDEAFLDDFDDITASEKGFLKLWNDFIKRQPHTPQKDIPKLTIEFVTQNYEIICKEGYHEEMLKHVTNLWDEGHINGDDLFATIVAYNNLVPFNSP